MPFIQPHRFAAAAVLAVLSNGITLTNSTNQPTTTFTGGFTPTTGKALVRVMGRCNTATSTELTCTIGGVACTRQIAVTFVGSGSAGDPALAMFTVSGLATGAPLDVVVSEDQGSSNGKIVCRIDELPASYVISVGTPNSNIEVTSSVSSIAASITTVGANKLIVGLGGAVAGALTMSASGWTEDAEANSGTGVGTSCDCGFYSRNNVGAATLATLTVAGSGAHTDYACALMELL